MNSEYAEIGVSGDPVAEFARAVQYWIDRGKSRQVAESRVKKDKPGLHERYLAATGEEAKIEG